MKKKLLLIFGIICTVAGAADLLLSGLFMIINMNTMDAPASLYRDQRIAALIFLTAGVIFLFLGILLLKKRRKHTA